MPTSDTNNTAPGHGPALPIAIGDVHGRLDLLDDLLTQVPGRPLIFLGDLTDRGPDSPGVMRRVRALVEEGRAQVCLGNHDLMLYEHVLYGRRRGRGGWTGQGGTPEQWETPQALLDDARWIQANHQHSVTLGEVLFAHAMRPDPNRADVHLWGRPDTDAMAPLPPGVRVSVHGHTPMKSAQRGTYRDGSVAWFIDTGAVYTGCLSALDCSGWQVITASRPS